MIQDSLQLNIPEDFLNAETRYGTYVSSEMKKIWAVELDLLYVFQRFCRDNDLKWFLTSGSLIGAIRHKGIIPWDNDIDIMMPRKDFDKLCEIAPDYFQKPYFFQTPVTEKGNFYRSYAKLCNSETTGCSEREWLQGINGGIFIDIFVLDSIPENKLILKYYLHKINHITHLARFLSPYKNNYSGIKHKFWLFFWRIKGSIKGDYIFQKVQSYCQTLNKLNGNLVAFVTSGYNEKKVWDKEWWENSRLVPFEFLNVPIPEGYDKILKKQYGDYMTPPNTEERATHDYLCFSSEIPYYKYFTKKGEADNN